MAASDRYTVFHVLHGANVPLKGTADLGDGILGALWERDETAVTRYETPTHHTLSLYLDGGAGNRRLMGRSDLAGGGPGALCLFPQGVSSDWLVDGWIRLFHLYIPRAAFDRAVVEGLDADPAHVTLRDLTYFHDPMLEQLIRGVMLPLDWSNPAERLAMSHAARALIAALVSRFTNRPAGDIRVTGGLAPAVRRRLEEYIRANLDQPLSIDDLAGVAGLSPFHFARAFKRATGEGPHAYVSRRRIEQAQALLRDGRTGLAETALACGFANQSHFTARFRAAVGLTPGAFAAIHRQSGGRSSEDGAV